MSFSPAVVTKQTDGPAKATTTTTATATEAIVKQIQSINIY